MVGIQSMTFAVFVCSVLSGEVPPTAVDDNEFRPIITENVGRASPTTPIELYTDPVLRRLSETNSTGLDPGVVVAITAGSIAGTIALVGGLYWIWSVVKGAPTMSGRPAGYVRPSGFVPPSGFAFGEAGSEPATEMPLLRISTAFPSAQQPRRH